MDSHTGATLDDEDRSIQILVWFIFTAATLSVVIGLGMKYIMVRKLGPDDWLLILAQVGFTLPPPPLRSESCCKGGRVGKWAIQCISTAFGVSAGLGKPWRSSKCGVAGRVSQGKGLRFLDSVHQTTEYASTVLLILALAIVKWSILVFIERLSRNIVAPRIRRSVSAFVGVWFATATISSLFQCAVPKPWDYINGHQCLNRQAWWAYVSIVNMLTEICIATLYLLVIYKVQISRSKKIVVLSLFLTRLLVVAAAIAQLVMFFRAYPSPDLTQSLKIPIILNQTTLSVSVVTACVPYLKPFMENLDAGFVVRVPSLARSEDGFNNYSRGGTDSYTLTEYSNSAACRSVATNGK
ncbi:hypothetical protein PG987_010752 [Apiospora arundinis]